VRALLAWRQLVLRPPRDDLALVHEVMPDQLEQRQCLRDTIDERHSVVQRTSSAAASTEDLVECDLWDGLALQLDVDAHPFLVGVVLQRVVRHRNLGERSGH